MGRKMNVKEYHFPEIENMILDHTKPYGPQIKHLRTNCGMTLRELGEKVGRSNQSVSHFEGGAKIHKGYINTAINYLKVFNVKSITLKID